MAQRKIIRGKEIFITNTRADGTQQDSMEGVLIPLDNPFYAIRDGLNRKIINGELEWPPKKKKETCNG
jgi:hypothetical protein